MSFKSGKDESAYWWDVYHLLRLSHLDMKSCECDTLPTLRSLTSLLGK